MFSVFLAMATSLYGLRVDPARVARGRLGVTAIDQYRALLRRNHEHVVGCLAERMEVGRGSAPRAGHELPHPALVDAHSAVHPVDLAAPLGSEREQRGDLVLRGGVILLGQ